MEQTMKHLSAINRKAERVEAVTQPFRGPNGHASAPAAAFADPPVADRGPNDVVALQQQGGGQPPQQPEPPHIPPGCSLVFSPGWEADRTGGTAGLCQPVERDLFDCHMGCFWPAQVPDQLNHSPDWTAKCAAAQKDWRKIDLVFPG
jgi:hypothetical protein